MGSKEGNDMKYIVTTYIYATVEADTEKQAEQKATDYFDRLNFSGLDIDVDNDYDIEPCPEDDDE